MTEGEAKTKWCPHSRISITYDDTRQDDGTNEFSSQHSMNRHSEWPGNLDCPTDVDVDNSRPPACFCIASACMAWRWIEPPPYPNGERPAFGYRERGYCGLAGKP